jgi:hypothetical protein
MSWAGAPCSQPSPGKAAGLLRLSRRVPDVQHFEPREHGKRDLFPTDFGDAMIGMVKRSNCSETDSSGFVLVFLDRTG